MNRIKAEKKSCESEKRDLSSESARFCRSRARTIVTVETTGVCFRRDKKEVGTMNDEPNNGSVIDGILKSSESCHPVQEPKRDLSEMCGNKAIERL
jgi:hypothetical protein